MDPRWLLRMSQWARNPPSTKRVIVVFAIISAALAVGLVEWLGYWPDWATAERIPRRF